MFETRNHKRTFYNAPQSIESLIAAFLEPGIIVATFLLVNGHFDETVRRPALTLCLLVFALTFPGQNRFNQHPASALVDVISSWIFLLGILALCGYATDSIHFFETDVLMWWAIITPVFQVAAIGAGRRIQRWRGRDPKARRTAVIIGAGPLGHKVARTLRESQGVICLGFFDDRNEERLHPDAGAELLGQLSAVANYVQENGVRDVYITLPLGSQPRIVALLEQIQGTTASINFVPDVFGISIIQGRLQDMAGVPVVGLCETPFTGINSVIKRASDIVLSSMIIVAISPILLFTAIGVRLSSPGPVIFKQRRYGLDGEEIVVYKFRSMTVTEDGDKQYKQVSKGDARVTRFGAFIRKTSLDELPQFINVLQGRMSIVGPRPHAIAVNEHYRKLISAYMVRHKVKPGITGWAQVNGYRGGDDLEHMIGRVEYDLEYLRNWSLALDFQIILRTARLVVFDSHAY